MLCHCCVVDVGIRVNLSSCETFVDLVVALGKSLQSARNHYNFSFATVTEEVCVANSSYNSLTSNITENS